MEFSAQMIAGHLNGTIDGDPDVIVTDVSKIEAGRPGSLSFLANPKYEKHLYTCESSIVLINKDFKLAKPIKATLIRVDNAYESFAALLELYQQAMPQKSGVDEKVSIDESAMIGENCYIGAFSVISKNAFIGNNVKIYPQVFIDEDVIIGDNTTIYSGVKIYKECKVGKDCMIHSGTVIGSDGFGFAPQEDGTYKKIPQLGNVVLEDNIEIGSNCSLDRATMGSTIIRQGTKLDNLIQIAHNVDVGRNSVYAAQTGIAGSSKVGDNCMCGGQVGIVGHLTLGKNIKIMAKTGVMSNIKDGELLFGTPSMPARQTKKVFVASKQLPDIIRKVKELEETIKELQKKINAEN